MNNAKMWLVVSPTVGVPLFWVQLQLDLLPFTCKLLRIPLGSLTSCKVFHLERVIRCLRLTWIHPS